MSLYENLADGIIDRDEYAKLKQNYAGRAAECEKQMDALKESIVQIKEQGGEHREWMMRFPQGEKCEKSESGTRRVSQSIRSVWVYKRPGGQESSACGRGSCLRDSAHFSKSGGRAKDMGNRRRAQWRRCYFSEKLQD